MRLISSNIVPQRQFHRVEFRARSTKHKQSSAYSRLGGRDARSRCYPNVTSRIDIHYATHLFVWRNFLELTNDFS